MSAVFAELTAIFAKLGLAGVNTDMTTLNRTVKWVGILMMGAGVLVLK